MNCVSEIFIGMNFQNLREFILTGDVGADMHHLSYEEKLENEMKPVLTRLERLIHSKIYDPTMTPFRLYLQSVTWALRG